MTEFPRSDDVPVDTATALAVEAEIERVRQVRRWRDLVGVPAGAVLDARLPGRSPRTSSPGWRGSSRRATRRRRWRRSGAVEILASGEIDAEQARERIAEHGERLRSEIERAERKLANEGFVAKAPEDVVAAEREKLERYRRELEELGA